MSQRNTGLHGLLSFSFVHATFQWLVGANRFQKRFVDQFVQARPGQRLLDVGCGTGSLKRFLPDVDYVGYDQSPAYIQMARKQYEDGAEFHVGEVAEMDPANFEAFDIVIAVGLLHHLDDDDVHRFCDVAWDALANNGRLVTIDPTFVPKQSRFAKWLIKRDRGMNVRRPEEQQPLVQARFANVTFEVRTDLLRIPYTHLILTATKKA